MSGIQKSSSEIVQDFSSFMVDHRISVQWKFQTILQPVKRQQISRNVTLFFLLAEKSVEPEDFSENSDLMYGFLLPYAN